MKSLSYLNKYLFKYKWQLILGIIFIIISNYFGVEMPKLVKNAVNDFLTEINVTSPTGIVELFEQTNQNPAELIINALH